MKNLKSVSILVHHQTKLVGVLAVSLVALSPIAHADWGVGLGVDNHDKQYKDIKHDVRVLTNIQYRGEKFNIGDGLSYDFSPSNKYAVEAYVTSKNSGFEASDGKAFKGLSEREPSLDIGLRGIMETGIGPVVVEATKDVNSSKGYQAEIKLGGISPHSSHWEGKRELNLGAAAGVRYQSKKVVDYYYGVKSTDPVANGVDYKGKSATTPFVGVEAQMNLTKHVSLNADLGYEWRDSSIKNSPLTTNKKGDVTAFAGITYWF